MGIIAGGTELGDRGLLSESDERSLYFAKSR